MTKIKSILLIFIILFVTSHILSIYLNKQTSTPNNNCNQRIIKLNKQTTNKYSEYYHLYRRLLTKLINTYYISKYYIIKNNKVKPLINLSSRYNIYNKDCNKSYRIIAHAGGIIENYTYTDSLEALNNSYKKGYKLFELDIRKTSDDIFVAVHNWKEWKKNVKYNGTIPPNLKDFKQFKLFNKFTPLDMDDINLWFCKHKDAILVTDKINSPIEFSRKFIDKKRLIMELFTWQAIYSGIKEDIKVMPTWRILSLFNKNIIHHLLELDISFIAVNHNTILKNKKLLNLLQYNNIKVYTFNVNKNEKNIICNELNLFYGIYADNWDFSSNVICK